MKIIYIPRRFNRIWKWTAYFVSLFIISLFSLSAHAAVFHLPKNNDSLVGDLSSVSVKPGDTLIGITQRHDLGSLQMLSANPHIQSTTIELGTHISIPSLYVLPPLPFRRGIVINIPELRLYYFTPDGYVMTYPLGIGRQDWRTPIGETKVIGKKEKPIWHVPKSIKQHTLTMFGVELPDEVPPGPENPLGEHALYFAIPGYLLHGNNLPWSIGQFSSSGCVRMYNEDVAILYKEVDMDTPVFIIHQPYKAGWRAGKLYLEVHPPIQDKEGLYAKTTISAVDVLRQTAREHANALIDWAKVDQVIKDQTGIPAQVGYDPRLVDATQE
jgi:L,D-transpeptidase ErfK/SrfK